MMMMMIIIIIVGTSTKHTALSSLGQRHTQHGVCLVNESQEEFSTTEQKEFFHGTQMGQEIGILDNQ